MALCSKLPIDLSFQKDDIYRRFRRLAVFDMDSTLIQHEVIDELAIEAGVGDKVAAITESAMRGEIDFRESLKQRVAMLKGLPESTLQVWLSTVFGPLLPLIITEFASLIPTPTATPCTVTRTPGFGSVSPTCSTAMATVGGWGLGVGGLHTTLPSLCS